MKGRLNGLDLFSGIGGNTLGLREYIKTIAYCENDRHAQSVLLSRMADGSIEQAPIWDDITTLREEHFDCQVDILVGGFPCQDISVAGKGEGIRNGNRSGLFYQIMRITDEIKPTLLFLENVPAIRTKGLDIVLQELTKRGYNCRWTMLSAAEIGAPHKRARWFLLANTNQRGLQETRAEFQTTGFTGEGRECRRTIESRLGGMVDGVPCEVDSGQSGYLGSDYWQKEPQIPRITQEKNQRTERIKRLGNAVVPLQAKIAFEYLFSSFL